MFVPTGSLTCTQTVSLLHFAASSEDSVSDRHNLILYIILLSVLLAMVILILVIVITVSLFAHVKGNRKYGEDTVMASKLPTPTSHPNP